LSSIARRAAAGSGGDFQLLENGTQMRVYRTGTDDELICDAGVAQPAGYEA
jgi:hypothetical protein